MSPKMKQNFALTILTLMGGVFVTGVLSWSGVELINSHDNNINSKHISEKVDDIDRDVKAFIERADELLLYINENKTQIKIVNTKLDERFSVMKDRMQKVDNYILNDNSARFGGM